MSGSVGDALPVGLSELVRKAEGLLGSADSGVDAGRVVSVEDLLRSAIETEMDLARLRKASILLSEFERFYMRPGPDGGKAALLIEETPFLARLTLIPPRGAVEALSPAQILEQLKARGIVHGIREPAIRAAAECVSVRQGTVWRLPVAVGEDGQDGEDGSVTFAARAFDKRILFDPDEPFFGDLLGQIEEVKAGALVARIAPQTSGKPGRDVRGKPIAAMPGLAASLGVGEGLQIQGDGKEIHAALRGSLVVGDEAIHIVSFHVVDGQLGVGHDIAYDGNVLVTGHVTGPVRIQARDIFVAGTVEGALLSATGDVWIGGKIQGKATVEAEGRFCARSASDVTIKAIGDVVVRESIVESRVSSGGKVTVLSPQGVIEGGEVSAFRGIWTHTLGSSFGLATTARVGTQDLRGPLVGELEKRIRENEETLSKVDTLKAALVGAGVHVKDLAPDRELNYIAVLRKEIQALEELRALRRRHRKLAAGQGDGPLAGITVAGQIHPPVTVELREVSEVIRERLEGVVLTSGADRKLAVRKIEIARSGATSKRTR